MRRRDFLRVASGAAGGAATAGAAAAASDGGAAAVGATLRQENNTTTGNETGDGAGSETSGGGGTETVTLVDYAFEGATENPLYVTPGTTVRFVWETDNHNIVVDGQPEGASWEGHEPIENSGFEYEHTFETEGEYEFYCNPHESLGMVGTIVVNQSGEAPGSGGGGEMDPEEMGVPFQAHFVGIATIVMIIVSLIFTFFTLKYGESANASSPNRK